MGLREALRALLDSEAGEVDVDEADEAADEVDETADEIDETADEVDEDADEGETPGTEEGDAEDSDLREIIRTQAAEIETLRNRLAELTGDEVAVDEAAIEDDTDDEDVVEAFDNDYAERKARLAEITEGN